MVVSRDTHVGKWIEDTGRLDHDQWLLSRIVPLVPEGGTVIDAGALYGDHTIAYARAVGEHGTVYAFEPNPEAFICLRNNMDHFGMSKRVTCCQVGLSDQFSSMGFRTDENTGASHLVGDAEKKVPVIPLDQMSIENVGFIKLDVEGHEVNALNGAMRTLLAYRPIVVCEVNVGALERNGRTVKDLYEVLW